MSLSLFTIDLERWALDYLFLISPVPIGGFEFCDLQVRALSKCLLFGGSHSAFGHLEVLHEPTGVSWIQVIPFEGKKSDLVAHFSQTGATWPLGDIFL